MNKHKLIVRIVAGILVAVIALGLIIPYVSATEIQDVVLDNTQEENTNETEIPIPPKPDQELPDGFEYVLQDNRWVVEKTSDNTKPAIRLIHMPYDFDTAEVVLFVGNIQTHEVKCVTLYCHSGYISSVDLEDGYYVAYANGYAWSSKDGEKYMINSGEYRYFYVGDVDKYEIPYGVEFESANDIFTIALGYARNETQTVPYNSSLIISENDLIYPEDAKLSPLEDEKDHIEPSVPNSDSKDPIDPDESKDDEIAKITVFDILKNIIYRYWFLITCIVLCYVGLTVIKFKKKIQMKQRLEEDQLDSRRIE